MSECCVVVCVCVAEAAISIERTSLIFDSLIRSSCHYSFSLHNYQVKF